MFVWLITRCLRYPYVVLAGAVLVSIAGLLSIGRLNFDAFPDTTPVQVQINTVVQGLVPEEIERQITFPIELAMGGLPGLEQVRSVSQFGLSQVVVTFSDRIDIYFARQLINERLSTVKIPPGIDRPEMGPIATGVGEVFHYLLTSESRNLTDLRTLHDWVLKPKLRPTRGVAEVNSWGGFEKQYQVRVDPNRLIKHNLSFEEVTRAVAGNNLNVGGGSINLRGSGEMLLVHGIGRTTDLHQIEGIVVAAHEGVPILLKDVAEISIGHELRRGLVTAGGKGEAVLGLGFMLMGENSYAVTERLKARMEEVKTQLPEDVSVRVVYDRTRLVDQVIATVRANLFDGALLVVAILFVFLGSLRAGLIVALAIPLSMMFAFSAMLQAGIAGTLLSLGAIDFGIVVDSSVIIVENVVHRLAHAGDHATQSRSELVREASLEVRQPAIFGQLIIMIVYLPILTLEGVEGKMFRPMAWTVIFVLVASLVISLTLMPVLASLFLPKTMTASEPLFVRMAQRLYRPLLSFAVRARWAVIGFAAAAMISAILLGLRLGSEFVPRLSEGAIVIGVSRMAGTDLSESERSNTMIERTLLAAYPDEIENIWTRTGAPEVATDPSGVEMGDVFVSLTPRAHWKRAKSQAELVEAMQETMADLPGTTIWFTQPIEQRINEMISGVRSDVALKLFGSDLNVLVDTARRLGDVLATVPGCSDLVVEQLSGQPVMQVRVNQDEIARYGVSAETVLNLVESIGSKPLGTIIEGQITFPLVARLPESLRHSPESVGSILVPTAAGERIPLSRLADIRLAAGPRMISREWSNRRISVQCNVQGRDVGSFVAEAQQKIASEVKLPDQSYRVEWGGQFENMKRAQARLAVVVPLALGLIGLLLWFSYRNVVDTLLVFTGVPLASIGGIVALWWRELPISISAAVGFITLSGVSVLNSMVYASTVRHLEKTGAPDPVRESALLRLRTVMMTTLVACFGFLPMATSTGVGAEVQRPLATVVIGGVVSSTFMVLLLMPALYSFAIRKPRTIASTPT